MSREVLYKGYIRSIKKNYDQTPITEIIYRIKNYKNTYFFVEEISTGCIFPIYGFANVEENYQEQIKFNQYSYIKSGKYFVYVPLSVSDNVFEFKLAEKIETERWEYAKNPTIDEINKYLESCTKDSDWKTNLKMMELHNKYHCDIKLIKEKLAEQKNTFTTSEKNLEVINYEPYNPCIDISEIKEFGYDLSEQDNLCNLIGREEEKKHIIKSIIIKKQSVLLVGPSGSGKTSLIESLADEIKKGTNKWLKNKIIFYVNIASILNGTKYRGDFEKSLQKLIDFCLKYKEYIILFIDEIHNLYGLGRTEDSAIDAMNILKPYIIKRELTILGVTTDKEYKEYIMKDPAFENRFDKVMLKAPDEQMNIEILLSYIDELELNYNIRLNLDNIKKKELAEYIVRITDKKYQNVVGDIPVENPKLAKKIIEDAFVEAIYNEAKSVSLENIEVAIISCDKLSPTFRKEKAEQLKNKIQSIKKTNKKVLTLVKTT